MKLLILTISLCLLPALSLAQDTALVQKVVDGDTLKLANGQKVRLIGIDTPERYENDKLYRDSQRTGQNIPEILEMGKQAHEFTQRLVEGKRVRLEYDLQKKDDYGRLLAYVYLLDSPPNNTTQDQLVRQAFTDIDLGFWRGKGSGELVFVNATIVKAGYAQLMTIAPNVKYADLFSQLYQQAKENNRGLWNK